MDKNKLIYSDILIEFGAIGLGPTLPFSHFFSANHFIILLRYCIKVTVSEAKKIFKKVLLATVGRRPFSIELNYQAKFYNSHLTS